MHQREAVDEDGDVVAVGVASAALAPADLVLVDDLQAVVVDVRLVDQGDVLGRAVVAGEELDVVFLDADRLVDDALVRAGDLLAEEPVPLGVGECDAVERFELGAEVGDQVGFGGDRQVLVGLRLEQRDELAFQFGFGLVGGRIDLCAMCSATTVLSP